MDLINDIFKNVTFSLRFNITCHLMLVNTAFIRCVLHPELDLLVDSTHISREWNGAVYWKKFGKCSPLPCQSISWGGYVSSWIVVLFIYLIHVIRLPCLSARSEERFDIILASRIVPLAHWGLGKFASFVAVQASGVAAQKHLNGPRCIQWACVVVGSP